MIEHVPGLFVLQLNKVFSQIASVEKQDYVRTFVADKTIFVLHLILPCLTLTLGEKRSIISRIPQIFLLPVDNEIMQPQFTSKDLLVVNLSR